MTDLHPSQEHELALASSHRRILDRGGEVVGVTPRILPGSLEEREALARIDEERSERPRDVDAERRRLRRHWSTRARHEA